MQKQFMLAFFLLSLQLFAQDMYHTDLNTQLQTSFGLPAVSQWVLPNTETATLNGAADYGSTVTNFTPAGQVFSQARRLTVSQGIDPWDAGHLYASTSGIANGDKCLLVIWLRSTTPNAKVNFFAENSGNFFKEVIATINLASSWKMYVAPFVSTTDYPVNALHVGLHLAYLSQTIEVGGAAVLNYKNTVQLSQLPVLLNNDSYDGMDPNAPWRDEAEANIEQIRKANLTVQVRNPNGDPLPNAQVSIEMQQHEFKFGTAVVGSMFNGGSGQNDTYEQFLLNLDGAGHGFNELVFENDLKWRAWEENWSIPWEIAADVQWLKDHDISIRGHNLVWPGWQYSPLDLELNQGNPDYLRTRIRNHIISILQYPGIGTEMQDWDVLNEITHNTDYANALAGTPGYVTGRELYAEIFKLADSLAPNSKLYLNDYVAIEQGDSPSNGIAVWKTYINELIANGAPLEGIGFQGHIGASPTGIPRIKEIYDDFWTTYGLEAKITEFDFSHFVPAQTQAQYMRDILTISFAHPSLKGFLMWGFWDGAHWAGNAPIFNLDWSLKPSGEAFVDQVFHQWWTNNSALTTASGDVTLRGFKGKYRLRVTCGNLIQEQDLVLDGNKTLTVFLNCTTGTQETENEVGFWTSPSLVSQQLEIYWETAKSPDFVQIFDLYGQKMAGVQKPVGQACVFDSTHWPNGVYIVNADFNGQMVSRRIIVQR